VNDSYTIREARKVEVWAFFQHVIESELSGLQPSLFDQDRLNRCNAAYVAEKADEVVGVITLDYGDSTGRAELSAAYVLRAHRGAHVGSDLLETAARKINTERPGRMIVCNVTSAPMYLALMRVQTELPKELGELLMVDPADVPGNDELLPGEDFT
jgi:hypothetical protein